LPDEPTGNLDPKKTAEIIELLKALNEQLGMTLLVITHDPLVAKQAKHLLLIKDGQISLGAKWNLSIITL